MKSKFLWEEHSELLGWVSVGGPPHEAPRHLFRHQLTSQVKLVTYGCRRSLTLVLEMMLRAALERHGSKKGDGVQHIDDQASARR